MPNLWLFNRRLVIPIKNPKLCILGIDLAENSDKKTTCNITFKLKVKK